MSKKVSRKSLKRPQIVIYPDVPMIANIAQEGIERHRKLGPTVLAIVREYFEAKAAKDGSVNPS